MSYSASERETVVRTDDEIGKWTVHTYQSKIQTKLRNLGIDPVSTTEDGGAMYELNFNQVSFRAGKKCTSDKPRKPMSEEHKQKLKDGREAKKTLN